jgi:phage/plasmid primase-like uncharacterized protein
MNVAADRDIDWASLLPRFGVGAEHLSGKHVACPGCGGKDRFRFDDKGGRGGWICNQGGDDLLHGDGYDLLCHVHGWSLREAFREVRQALGISPEGVNPPALPKPPPGFAQRSTPQPTPNPTQPYALSIWAAVDRSDDAVASHPYAQAKGIDWHAGAGRATVSGRIVGKGADCLVIPIREIANGNIAAVQAINRDGAKQTFGPVKGCAFICGNDLDATSGWFVVEGWADAVSVFRQFHGSCVFAAMGKDFRALTERIVAHYQPRHLVLLEDAE